MKFSLLLNIHHMLRNLFKYHQIGLEKMDRVLVGDRKLIIDQLNGREK